MSQRRNAPPTMAGRSGGAAADQQQQRQLQNNDWVSVTWMPHTNLSQTSHVCLSVRSAHAVLDPLLTKYHQQQHHRANDQQQQQWKVRVGVYGVGGLPLVPLPSHTAAASLVPRRRRRRQMNNQDQQQQQQGEAAMTTTTTTRSDDLNNNSNDTRGGQRELQLRPTVGQATHDCVWDTFIELPIRWRDLPRDAYLHFEILGRGDAMIFQTTMPFFSRYGKLGTGLRRLELQSTALDPDRNYGLWPLVCRNERDHGDDDDDDDGHDYDDPVWHASCILDKLHRFEERAKSQTAPSHQQQATSSFGQIDSVPWLDALQKERCEQVITSAAGTDAACSDAIIARGHTDTVPSFLIVELPVFEIPIMHEETFYPMPQLGASGTVAPLDLSIYRKRQHQQELKASSSGGTNVLFDPLQLVPFLDYENEHDNPVEDKYRTLAHDLIRGLVDPALKPDRTQRDRLAAIIDSPSHHPTREEKDLLWRFRFSLVDNRRALTKFLLAVDWTVESEVVQAAELLEQWRRRSPIEVTDALKLLGKHVAFQTNLVRAYAIDTLASAPDSELRLYLLQLVQALKYENMEIPDASAATQRMGSSTATSSSTSSPASQDASLATFLINRAAANVEIANYLYWYLKVELQIESNPWCNRYRAVFSALQARLSDTPFAAPVGTHLRHIDESGSATPFKSIVSSVSKLGSSLRGDHSGSDRDRTPKRKPKSRSIWDVLTAQDSFISGTLDIQQQCRDARGKKDVKELQLRKLLSEKGYDRNPQRDSIPLPSAPDILVNGLLPETAKMFKSALYPALIDFHVEARIVPDDDGFGGEDVSQSQAMATPRGEGPLPGYKVIAKTGDDLRQDQLVIMMIQLMDGLLKRAALDLCLTPYSIIALSPTSGLVEFVDGSLPVSQILSNFGGSIMQFFQSKAPQKEAKHGIRPDVISTYVRSCAGYCVITYLLAVGDRHLDNILLRETGHFFHIDFGFMFGRDPKPLPPAFRLTREMVDGMGGVDSQEYRQFCSLACQAFNALRKSAGLVLNLLHLMSDAGIEDLSNNPLADAEGVIAKVEERFRLDLTDEQAERYFLGLINDCLAAIAPRVMDVFHSFSVARR